MAWIKFRCPPNLIKPIFDLQNKNQTFFSLHKKLHVGFKSSVDSKQDIEYLFRGIMVVALSQDATGSYYFSVLL